MVGLKGKVALVTGATRGIGRAIAIRLAEEGAKVIIDHPGEDQLAEEVVSEIRQKGQEAIDFSADVSDSREVKSLFALILRDYHTLDILVNNAGICPFVEWFDLTEELWERVHSVNLKGAFLCSQHASRIMMAMEAG